jgi:hypothetical protein
MLIPAMRSAPTVQCGSPFCQRFDSHRGRYSRSDQRVPSHGRSRRFNPYSAKNLYILVQYIKVVAAIEPPKKVRSRMKKLYHFTSRHHLHGVGRFGLTVGDVPTNIHRWEGRCGVWLTSDDTINSSTWQEAITHWQDRPSTVAHVWLVGERSLTSPV